MAVTFARGQNHLHLQTPSLQIGTPVHVGVVALCWWWELWRPKLLLKRFPVKKLFYKFNYVAAKWAIEHQILASNKSVLLVIAPMALLWGFSLFECFANSSSSSKTVSHNPVLCVTAILASFFPPRGIWHSEFVFWCVILVLDLTLVLDISWCDSCELWIFMNVS